MPKITRKNEKSGQLPDKSKSKPAAKKQQLKQTNSFPSKNNFVESIEKKGFLIALSLIILISLIVFKDFIFLKYIYLFKDIGSDSINIDYPAAVLNSNMFAQQPYFTWTFYSGLGYPMNSGIFNPLHPLVTAYTILKPFFESIFSANPAFLRFPVFMTILILTGITAYLYFKTLNYSAYISIVGSLLVSFMGYNIASSAWNHYYDVFYGIFLLFAFEQFYKKNRWYFLPIAVMMISFNFFNLYIYGVFLITYILFRFYSEEQPNPMKIFPLGLKVFGLSIWGLLMGVANFLPNLINAMNSPRVSDNIDAIKDIATLNPLMNSKSYELSTAVLRTFSSDIMGTGSDFKGWYNYLEAPLFYCGLISLLLIPQIFVFLRKKDKIIFGSFAGLWLLVVLFPGLRNAFHLFIGNYYKVGINFFIPMILIFYGIKSLSLIHEHKKINIPVLIISLLVLLIALFYPYKIENIELTDKSIRNYSALILLIYAGFIYLLVSEKYQRLAQFGILTLLVIELCAFSFISVSKRINYSATEFRISEGGYKDNTIAALTFLKENDRNFFRLEKDYSSGTAMHGSLNDSQVQGYFGTCLYSSFNQPYYIKFLRETDIIEAGSETGTRWAPGLRNRPLLQTIASVKYNLSKQEKPFLLNAGYSEMKVFNDVKLMKNEYFIPFGFCYSSYITSSDFNKCSSLQKDINLLRAIVIDENSDDFNQVKNTLSRLELNDTVSAFNFEKYKEFVGQRRKDTLKISEFKQNYIKGSLSVDSAKMLFLSIPFDKGWKVKVDGKQTDVQLINIGFLGVFLEKGQHVVELNYFPDYLWYSIGVTIFFSLIFIVLVFISKELNYKVRLILFSLLAVSGLFYIFFS